MKQFENNKPKLDLFAFFEGETIAYGIFEDRFGNLKRQFRVNIKGKIDIIFRIFKDTNCIFIYKYYSKGTRWKEGKGLY